MNIQKAILQANQILKKNNIKSSILDCEILMSKVINKDRKFVILNSRKDLEKENFEHFRYLVEQRLHGKPIAYLTGKKNFWNNEFKVNNDVLIPRPDTEIIIEEILNLYSKKNKSHILEIGVGSGCLLLSIMLEKKNFYGVGIDISKKCLDISKTNANKLGLLNRVKFFKSDVDNFNYGKYDLIISNPPYISHIDYKNLDKDVIDFEPKLALYGGIDGLSEIRKVISKSSELVKIKGKFILEIGFDQKHSVKKFLKEKGFYINKVVKDYANNDRCIISTKL